MAVEQDPRFSHPIPLTAGTVPFTPRSLHVDRLEREMSREIDIDLERLTAERADLPRQVEEGVVTAEDAAIELEVIDVKIAAVPDRREQAAEQIKILREKVQSQPIFMVKIPTPIERDRVQGRLRELGLVSIGLDRIRAEMIEALYEHQWRDADGNLLEGAANDAVADENADFLDGVWQRQAIYDKLLELWQEQEVERQMDRRAGALRLARAPAPPAVISPRERARQAMLIDDLSATSPRMRNIAKLQADFETENRLALVRIGLVDTMGVSIKVAVNPLDNAISKEDAIALRDALCADFGDKLGDAAWNELVTYIDRSYSLDGFEEKNSDWPLGTLSAPSGLNDQSGDTLTSGGSLKGTGSSSGPTRSGGSEKITPTSSDSTGNLETPEEPAAKSSSPTAED